jgi:hypothetical protein
VLESGAHCPVGYLLLMLQQVLGACPAQLLLRKQSLDHVVWLLFQDNRSLQMT